MEKNKATKPDAGTGINAELQRLVSIRVRDEADITSIVRQGKHLAKETGLNQIDQTYVATAISELATNLLFHAIEGRIIVKTVFLFDRKGLEIISEDEGPGIEDIELALKDGYSTKQGLGSGLGGVQRIMDEFDIESTMGKGTRITVRIWKKTEDF